MDEQQAIIREHYAEAVKHYPKLRKPVLENGLWVIYGRLDIIDKNGANWDTYEVKIEFPEEYPTDVPKFFEEEGKIERDKNWHVSGNGSCCLGPRVKMLLELSDGITLARWLELQAIPFLANHYLKKKTGKYIGDEFPHGAKGILKFYGQWWKLENKDEIVAQLRKISGRVKIGRNERCYCDSGIKYKKCHLRATDYMGVPITVFSKDLRDIETELQI